MNARGKALTEGRPFTEESPYNMAIYLHDPTMVAGQIIGNSTGSFDRSPGLGGLMIVIEERAALSSDHCKAGVRGERRHRGPGHSIAGSARYWKRPG